MSDNLQAYLDAYIEVRFPNGCWVGKPANSKHQSAVVHHPDFLNMTATVITAWNPKGENQALQEIQRLGRALEKDAAGIGLRFWNCIGKSADGHHAEESLWVLTPTSKERKLAEDLARNYFQEGIFVLHGAVRSLVIFNTDEQWSQSMIWTQI